MPIEHLTIHFRNGGTVLHLAAERGCLEGVLALTRLSRTRVASQDLDLRTPLHHACKSGHLEVVKTLISIKPCTIQALDLDKLTPFHLAILSKRWSVASWIDANLTLESDAIERVIRDKMLSMSLSSRQGLAQVVKAMVEGELPGGCLDVLDEEGLSPFGAAVQGRHRKVAQLLFEKSSLSTIYRLAHLEDEWFLKQPFHYLKK